MSIINISQFFVMKRLCTFSANSLSTEVSKASDKVKQVFFWGLPVYSAISTQESSSKMAQNKDTSRDEGGSTSSQLSGLTVQVFCPKKKLVFLSPHSQLHTHSSKVFCSRTGIYLCFKQGTAKITFLPVPSADTFSGMNIPSIFV